MNQVQSRMVLCVLHDNPNVVATLCGSFPGYQYQRDDSGNGPDERMPEAFKISDIGDRASLTEEDADQIRRHRNVEYVLLPRLTPETAHEPRLLGQGGRS